MSEEASEVQEEAQKKTGFVGKFIIWFVIFVMGVGAGAAVPLLTGSEPAVDPENLEHKLGVELMDFPEPGDETAFIDFEEVVVNLDDPPFSRYITINFSLQIAKTQELDLTKLVEEKKVVLKNWLLSHLRDKKLKEVRGKFGSNMLRREIHGKFNELLFTDGVERIQDVLFNDFKVQ